MDALELKGHCENVLKLISTNKGSATFDFLYRNSKGLSERTELSRVLHKLIEYKSIKKQYNQYWLIDASVVIPIEDDSKEKESEKFEKLVAKVVQPVKKEQTKEEKQKVAEPQETKVKKKENGKLRRKAESGMVAYVLYKFSGSNISAEVIANHCGSQISVQRVKAIIGMLLTKYGDDYVVKIGEGRKCFYAWSGKKNYPFSVVEETDCAMFKENTHHASDTQLITHKFDEYKLEEERVDNSVSDERATVASTLDTALSKIGKSVDSRKENETGYSVEADRKPKVDIKQVLKVAEEELARLYSQRNIIQSAINGFEHIIRLIDQG
jgi:hypothetical protein